MDAHVVFSLFFSVLASRVWLLSLHMLEKLYALSFESLQVALGLDRRGRKVGLLFVLPAFVLLNVHCRCELFLNLAFEVSVGICPPWHLLLQIFFSLKALKNEHLPRVLSL